MAINEALYANTRIPDELYFSPRNLGIKAKVGVRATTFFPCECLDDLLGAWILLATPLQLPVVAGAAAKHSGWHSNMSRAV
jgi:hypothetical protein